MRQAGPSAAPWQRRTAEVGELVAWWTAARPPTLGRGRLICIDGPAGSGKSTLGHAVLAAASQTGSARLLHVDDMLDGWAGLPTVARAVEGGLLAPLQEGRPGRYRRYDWHRGCFAEWHTVDPVDTLVLEGCGSGAASYGSAITTLVWVEAPRDLRLARGTARDGETLRPQWLAWMRAEEVHFAREGTRDRADVLVDGTGEGDPAVVLR